MPRRRRAAPERRHLPPYTDPSVLVPLGFVTNERRMYRLDPLDDAGWLMKAATGKYPPREPRPYDTLTAWVTLAHMGCLELGGPYLKPELDREQRLEKARELLTEAEFLIVESIAVPQRYRKLPATELEQMVRTAPDYLDRMWAGCWLTLTGWTDQADCPFTRKETEEFPYGEELEERIVEAYAHSIGVTSKEDALGWWRIDWGYEGNLPGRRLSICDTHYDLNGPPPYEHMSNTIPEGPGWRRVTHLVPEKRVK
jgi:hypothetical protein